MLRYKVLDEDGEVVRLFYKREECAPFVRTGCRVVVLPRPKKTDHYRRLLKELGESPL
jgi:hypothetical protein